MEPLLLLQRVREVCSAANPAEPTNVSRRAFDDAARASGASGLPAAGNIANALKLRWREVVAVAHEPVDVQNHRLGQKQTAPYQDWLTDEYVASVLKLAAHRLGVDTLTPDRYRSVAAELRAADEKRWLHGHQLLIPTDDQIIIACGGASANAPGGGGGWDRALALAGLKPRPGLGNQGMNRKAPPITDVMERFHEAYGVQPSFRDLKKFAKANKIPYSREEHKKWSEWVEEWKQSRRERGLAVPDGVPALAERADYTVDVGAALPGEQRLNQWTEGDCAAAVARYLAQLPAGERSSKRDYDDWAKQQTPRAPASSNFDPRGGWETIRRKAIATPVGRAGSPCSVTRAGRSLTGFGVGSRVSESGSFYFLVAPQSRLARLAQRHPWLLFCSLVGSTLWLAVVLAAPFLRHHDGIGLALYLSWCLFNADLYMAQGTPDRPLAHDEAGDR